MTTAPRMPSDAELAQVALFLMGCASVDHLAINAEAVIEEMHRLGFSNALKLRALEVYIARAEEETIGAMQATDLVSGYVDEIEGHPPIEDHPLLKGTK